MDKEAKVCELMKGCGEWNDLLIKNIFNKEEAEVITSIPLSRMEVEDKLVWNYDKKGQFSVKSAYILEFDSKRAKRGEPSRGRGGDRCWKEIWELKVPGKVKLFMWKAGNEILPTRRNLKLRKIVEDSICPICKEMEETVMHIVWQCPVASDVWAEFNKTLQKWSSHEDDLLSLWEKMMDKVGKAEMRLIASVMRGIWQRRNELIFEGVFKSPSQVIRIAKEGIDEFLLAQVKSIDRVGNNAELRNQVWKKPRESYVKANWDASLNQKERKMGLGVIIRDEEGEVLVVVEGQQSNVDQPAVAESYALWKAMEVCRDLNMERVIFEGDAQLIVKAVNDLEEDRSVFGSIVEASKVLISLWKDWSVEFVYRNANEAAHTLAKEALCLDTEIVWIEEIPNCIRKITEKERTCNERLGLYQ